METWIPLTPQELDILSALEQKATQGTWKACTANARTGGCACGLVWYEKEFEHKGEKKRAEDTVVSCCHSERLAKGEVLTAYEETPDGGFTPQQQANNMLFLAALRNAAPRLIAAARRLHELESRHPGIVQQDIDP